MIALRYGACFLGVAVALVTAAAVRANDIPPVPDAPCTLAERMNVHIVDGWMYSCDCEVLAHGFHCGWNLVGQVEESNAARKIRKPKKHSHRRLIPVLVIRVHA